MIIIHENIWKGLEIKSFWRKQTKLCIYQTNLYSLFYIFYQYFVLADIDVVSICTSDMNQTCNIQSSQINIITL